MMNFYRFLLIILIALLGVGCSSNLKKVKTNPFEFTYKTGGKTSGLFFSTAATNDAPFLIVFDQSLNALDNWQVTCAHFAQAGYNVLAINFWDFSPDSIFFLQPLFSFVKPQPGRELKSAVIGVGAFAETAIKIAAFDSTVKALITLDAANSLPPNISENLAKIPPRPFLFIEPTQNPQVPEKQKIAMFDSAGGPKKSVWLATSSNGSNILKPDMEPIVRRTVLLLVDRYLKGKM